MHSICRTRSPATSDIFSAFQFCRSCLYKGWKMLFPTHTHSLIKIFQDFPTFKKFPKVWHRKLSIGFWRRKKIIWYTIYRKYATFTDFSEKLQVFFETTFLLFQKTQTVFVLRNLTFAVAPNEKFLRDSQQWGDTFLLTVRQKWPWKKVAEKLMINEENRWSEDARS